MHHDTTPERRFPRLASRHAVLVNRLGDDPAEELTTTRTVGLGGCMITSDESYGEGLLVQILLTVDGHIVRADGRVVWERPVNGQWEIGVEFLRLGERDRELIEKLLIEW